MLLDGCFQMCLQYSTGAAVAVVTLIDQINVLNRVTRPHMISHSYVHPCTYERPHTSAHARTHTHAGWSSQVSADPLWGQEHRSPCGFPALWYHAGQIFLSAWMTPWHGVYLDWQLVFIWIDMQLRGRNSWTEGGSGHQEPVQICSHTERNNGQEEVGGEFASHHGCLHFSPEIMLMRIDPCYLQLNLFN